MGKVIKPAIFAGIAIAVGGTVFLNVGGLAGAVQFGRKQQWLPLLFGVPVFILCGFTHCIADAFYYCMASPSLLLGNAGMILLTYVLVVIGNLAGCNLYRLFVDKKDL